MNIFSKNKIVIDALCTGQILNIEQSSDPVFAQKMIGDGFYIVPENGHIYAPFNEIGRAHV